MVPCDLVPRRLGLRGVVEFVVKPVRLEGAQSLDPKILSVEEGVSCLLFCHGLVRDLFDDDDSEVVKRVSGFPEVLVN